MQIAVTLDDGTPALAEMKCNEVSPANWFGVLWLTPAICAGWETDAQRIRSVRLQSGLELTLLEFFPALGGGGTARFQYDGEPRRLGVINDTGKDATFPEFQEWFSRPVAQAFDVRIELREVEKTDPDAERTEPEQTSPPVVGGDTSNTTPS